MGGKGSFFILLFVVAFLSLTLAGLAGYVFFFAGPTQSAAPETTVNEKNKVVDESKLGEKQLFDSKKYFNLKSTDDKKISVIQVGIKIKYFKEVDKLKEKDILAKLSSYDSEIKEQVGIYFRNLTLEDVKMPDAEERARKVLVQQFNKTYGEKEDIVYSIIFDEWFYQ